jgi:hypothetical protein
MRYAAESLTAARSALRLVEVAKEMPVSFGPGVVEVDDGSAPKAGRTRKPAIPHMGARMTTHRPFSVFLLLFAVPLAVAAQQTATTKDGKTVILNPNGTWEYAKEEKPALTAPATTAGPPVENPSVRQMTDEQKLDTWKGEHVVLLRDSLDFVHDIYTCYNDRKLPADEYAGKSGTVVEVWSKDRGSQKPIVAIALDGTGEKIGFCTSSHLGFAAELDAARAYVGKTVWNKGRIRLSTDCSSFERQEKTAIDVPNVAPLEVTAANWGTDDRPVLLTLRTATGQQGCFYSRGHFLGRFAIGSGRNERYMDHFYFQDPRKQHPQWSAATWTLIEKGQVAIGMTLEMAKVACGEKLVEVGAVMSETSSATIYQGCGTKFLVDGGKVTKYAE